MKNYLLATILIVWTVGAEVGVARELIETEQTADQRGIRVRRDVKALPASARRYALIIGVDKYNDGGISNLDGATNDAKAIQEALIKYAGFLKEQVTLLTTDQPPSLQPTRSNILSRLDHLLSAAPKESLILIAFAGHGTERENRAFLLPTDAQIGGNKLWLLEQTAIPVEALTNQVKQSGVQQVIVILDACRNNPDSGRNVGDQPMTEAYTRGFNFEVRNGGIEAFVILFATRVGQVAYENKDKKQGYFSLALIEGLKGAASNEKGEVTLGSLKKYLEENVPRRVQLDLGKVQVPLAIREGVAEDELVLAFAEKPASTRIANPPVNATATSSNYGTLAYQAVEKAVEKMGKGDFQGAIEDYKFAIRVDPDNGEEYRRRLADVYSIRARIRHEQANYEGALADLSTAIDLAPHNPLFYNNRGVNRAYKGDLDRAIADFSKAIELDPRFVEAYVNRGNAYSNKGQKGKAKQDFDAAKQIDHNVVLPNADASKNPEVMARMGALIDSGNRKLNTGDFDGAINDYTQASYLNPRYTATYYLRAIARAGKEYFVGFLMDGKAAYDNGAKKGIEKADYERFTTEFTKEIESNPNNAFAYFSRALLHIFRGEKKKALSDISRAIAIDNNFYVAYVVKALAEEDKSGLADINKAIKIRPNGTSAYMIRFMIYLGNGKTKEADADLEMITKNSPPGEVDYFTLMIRRFFINGNRAGSGLEFLNNFLK